VQRFAPVNSKLHPACNLCFRTTWFATDNQLHIGSLFICFIQCFFFYAINYPFHAISVSELSGLLQTTNSTLVLYSFALCSVCFFMLLIIPFIAHLIGSYHTASIPLCAFHYTHFQQHCTPICFLKRFFSFFRKITPFKFISLFQERTSLKFPAIWVAGSTTTRLLLRL